MKNREKRLGPLGIILLVLATILPFATAGFILWRTELAEEEES